MPPVNHLATTRKPHEDRCDRVQQMAADCCTRYMPPAGTGSTGRARVAENEPPALRARKLHPACLPFRAATCAGGSLQHPRDAQQQAVQAVLYTQSFGANKKASPYRTRSRLTQCPAASSSPTCPPPCLPRLPACAPAALSALPCTPLTPLCAAPSRQQALPVASAASPSAINHQRARDTRTHVTTQSSGSARRLCGWLRRRRRRRRRRWLHHRQDLALRHLRTR
jgi:hypothetical protein